MTEKKMPKYKGELRKAIGEIVDATKNSCTLRDLYIISDILQRQTDETAYMTLSDAERNASLIIKSVIYCQDAEKLRRLRYFVNEFLRKDKKAGTLS